MALTQTDRLLLLGALGSVDTTNRIVDILNSAGTSGITSLNGLTGGTQTFASGTAGTNFAISSSGTAHTFNLPIASATNTGKLSSSDWSIFNAKGSGDVVGPASAVLNNAATFSNVDGKHIQDSGMSLYYDVARDNLGIGSPTTTITNNNNTLIGILSGPTLVSGGQNTLVGGRNLNAAANNSSSNVALGYFAGSFPSNSDSCVYLGVLAGGSSIGTAGGSIFIGYDTGTNTLGNVNGSIFIGHQATASGNSTGSIALGTFAKTTANNQFVCGGSSGFSIGDAYFGSGVVDTAPVGFTLNATGGSGTDIAGGSARLAGGKSTGAGLGGSVILSTSPASGSSATLNSLVDRLIIGSDGTSKFTGPLQSVAAQESTGAGIALLGANSPASTLAAPYKWIKMLTDDGSTVYFPVWK